MGTDNVYYVSEEHSGTPFGPLLLVVFNSILEVFILCLAGYILAGRGILDKKTQKQLNRLNVSLFTPALLFSKVAFFLTPAKLWELWIIPIFFVVVTVVSMVSAFLIGWLFRLKKSQRSFAMAAAMFMNSNSLPIALMQSLVVTVPGLQWDEDDNKDAMLGRALTYLVMYSTLGMVLRWSYGVRLLSQADPESSEERSEVNEQSPLLGSYDHDNNYTESQPSASTVVGSISDYTDIDTDVDANSNHPSTVIASQPEPHRFPRPPPRRRTTFYNSFPNSPNQSRTNLTAYDSTPSSNSISDVEPDSDAEIIVQAPSTLPTHVHNGHSASSLHPLSRWKRRLAKSWVAFNDFMTVPLWAAIASLVVACIRPLQYALDHDMQPIKGAITSAGKCSIPLTLIVLGAYFYPTPPDEDYTNGKCTSIKKGPSNPTTLLGKIRRFLGMKEKHHSSRHLDKAKPGETKTVIIAVASRMIITPLLLMPLMVFSAQYDFQAVFNDPVFVVANVLLVSSPPALTLAQITQAASGDAFERLISGTIFWSYCVVTPITTIIYVVIGLMLTRL